MEKVRNAGGKPRESISKQHSSSREAPPIKEEQARRTNNSTNNSQATRNRNTGTAIGSNTVPITNHTTRRTYAVVTGPGPAQIGSNGGNGVGPAGTKKMEKREDRKKLLEEARKRREEAAEMEKRRQKGRL